MRALVNNVLRKAIAFRSSGETQMALVLAT